MTTTPLQLIAAAPLNVTSSSTSSSKGKGSFFEAMAKAWGQVLDAQADRIQAQSDVISGGDDSPSAITELTALSLKMGFLANSSQTSISSVGQALETMARKG